VGGRFVGVPEILIFYKDDSAIYRNSLPATRRRTALPAAGIALPVTGITLPATATTLPATGTVGTTLLGIGKNLKRFYFIEKFFKYFKLNYHIFSVFVIVAKEPRVATGTCVGQVLAKKFAKNLFRNKTL
jgi:hypothetical protein